MFAPEDPKIPPQESDRMPAQPGPPQLFGAGARPQEGRELWFYDFRQRARENGERDLEPIPPSFNNPNERSEPGHEPRVGCIVCGIAFYRTCSSDR
ncbi:unnamed protein product [Cylicostephanus goldi]|uniref:Uncharacterized protein n=1 Tax=Cylicostephanus goldi TaxID=71465 RepID=A0A3P7MLX7_CYLGO|nr:unnamed protein product [Cylicostephanus goldi]